MALVCNTHHSRMRHRACIYDDVHVQVCQRTKLEQNFVQAPTSFCKLRQAFACRHTGALVAALKRSEVKTAFREKLVSATEDDNKVTTTFAGGSTGEFSMLVGADGVHSTA